MTLLPSTVLAALNGSRPRSGELPRHRALPNQSLQFKQVHPARPIFSARVALGYRALAVREGSDII